MRLSASLPEEHWIKKREALIEDKNEEMGSPSCHPPVGFEPATPVKWGRSPILPTKLKRSPIESLTQEIAALRDF